MNRIANTADTKPISIEPESPRKIREGDKLYLRKAISDPAKLNDIIYISVFPLR